VKDLWILAMVCLLVMGSACSREPTADPLEGVLSGGMSATGTDAQEIRTLPGTAVPTDTQLATNSPTWTATAVLTSTPTETPVPTQTSTVTPTPDPYAPYYIDNLAKRLYGMTGEIEIVETLAENNYFTRYMIRYPSDGLTIYGFMNVPKPDQLTSGEVDGADNEFPVVIALHGYIDPQIYDTIDYTTRYADSLARNGYLVLHPNLRNYPPSDNGDNLFRAGMAIDVLNLIALVKHQSDRPGILEQADGGSIGLWGHSMGGGIATRVITLSPDVKAAVLYGAMSGDDKQNFERIFGYFSNGERGNEELSAPDDIFQKISPINYLERVSAAVSIHHGKNDVDVPLVWSLDLCYRLRDLETEVECFIYDDMPHTFHGNGDLTFMQRMVYFYDRILKQ
jgi:dipeptidyl aminopeptidase/acylaminoacyl peptidase